MPKSYEVRLPEQSPVHFPSGCIVCGAQQTDSVAKVPVLNGQWGALLSYFGKGEHVEAPACAPCGRKVRFRYAREIITLFGVLFAAHHLVYKPFLKGTFPDPFDQFDFLISGLILASPLLYWRHHNPPVIEAYYFGGYRSFQFRHESYADAFSEQNEDYILPLG